MTDEEIRLADFQWFKDNQLKLAWTYERRFIVILKHTVLATFNEDLEAIKWAQTKFFGQPWSVYQAIQETSAYSTDCY